MNLNEYQDAAHRYDLPPLVASDWHHVHMFGLVGEAGEAAEKYKKSLRDGAALGDDFYKELGDVLWYISAIAGDHGFTLEAIARMNLEKLERRRRDGVQRGSGDNR